MLASPWNVTLTVLFVITGLICLGDLVLHLARRRGASRGAAPMPDHFVVDVNHAVMSAAMILMIWVDEIDVVLWAQVALFAIFALALLLDLRTASPAHRTDLAGHVGLNAAMIWMLAAMPLLMAGMAMDGSEASAHAEHEMDMGTTGLMSTPAWADALNLAFVAVSAAAALWWIVRLVTRDGHRVHTACHVLMAAGMATMLVVMNG